MQVPQLRLYLRPPSIRDATLAQWEAELPPFQVEYGRKREPIDLMKKYETYQANRRNKEKCLRRAALPVNVDVGLDDVVWAPLRKSIDVVDLTQLGTKEAAQVQARAT